MAVVLPPQEPVRFPLSWLLENAAPPIQSRSINEVARLGGVAGEAAQKLPYAFAPALLLALGPSTDGTWNRSMLVLRLSRSGDLTDFPFGRSR